MRKSNPKDNGVQLPFEDQAFIDKWQDWLEFRSQRRLPKYVPKGLKGTFTHLKNISGNDPLVACLIIQRSMDNNWQGLFALPKNYSNGTTHRGGFEEKPTPKGTLASGDIGHL